jgi:hypothetical protein
MPSLLEEPNLALRFMAHIPDNVWDLISPDVHTNVWLERGIYEDAYKASVLKSLASDKKIEAQVIFVILLAS